MGNATRRSALVRNLVEHGLQALGHTLSGGVDGNAVGGRGLVVLCVFVFSASCLGGVNIHLCDLGLRLEGLSHVAVGRDKADHDGLALGLKVLGDGLGLADVALPTFLAVVRVGGEGAQVVPVDMEGVGALFRQMREHGFGKGGFSVAGLACEPVNHGCAGNVGLCATKALCAS